MSSDKSVLDIGCGMGTPSFRCAKLCKNVVGIDHSYSAICAAKTMAEKDNIRNADFFCYDLEKGLDITDNSFDIVLFLDVIEHLNNRDLMLNEIKRVLSPNGILLLSAPNIDTSWKRIQKKVGINPYADSDHKIEYTKNDLFNTISRDFDIIKSGITTYDTPLNGIFELIGGISIWAYVKLSEWKMRMIKLKPKETTGFRIVARVKK